MSTEDKRVFEGRLNHEDEMGSQDAFIVVRSEPPYEIAYWQRWVNGLYGRHVRVTVEDLGPDHKCSRCDKPIDIQYGICGRCADKDAP